MIHPTKILFSLSILLMWIFLMGIHYSTHFLSITAIALSLTLLFTSFLNILPRTAGSVDYSSKLLSLLYFFWLIKEIYKSSYQVIKIIWRKRLNLTPALQWIDSNQSNELGEVIYSNSITLTPGTIAVDLQENKILVHALDRLYINDLKEGTMSKLVKDIIC